MTSLILSMRPTRRRGEPATSVATGWWEKTQALLSRALCIFRFADSNNDIFVEESARDVSLIFTSVNSLAPPDTNLRARTKRRIRQPASCQSHAKSWTVGIVRLGADFAIASATPHQSFRFAVAVCGAVLRTTTNLVVRSLPGVALHLELRHL